jgi:predicted tellurium resistance membrane protein TerC
MNILKKARTSVLSGRYNTTFAFALMLAFALVAFPDAAFAQDPFGTARTAAQSFSRTFASFALAVGAIGMISCLLLGFFGKLNWKWVATGVGVSFGIAIVTPAITWLNGLGG